MLRYTLVGAGLLLGGCDGSAGSSGRLNLILISLDTCRADRLSCYGAERENTPNLDALARESVVFSDCLAQSSETGPSHLSIFTGQHVQRHGLLQNGGYAIPRATIASVLHEAGWSTAAFTGHGSLRGKFGHGVGFEVFQSWPPGAERAPPFMRNLSRTIPEALTWLDDLAEEPFFLFVHGYEPHLPFWPEEPWRTDFAGWYGGDMDISTLRRRTDFRPLIDDGRLGEQEVRYLKDLYDGEVAAADKAIGSFLAELRERGLMDHSIVVFTSDHGEVLGDHDWVGHGVFWQEVLHVPLMIRFPSEAWAGWLDQPVQHVDVLPTLLSALGQPSPAGVQGVDLMPLIRREVEGLAPRLRVGRLAEDVTIRFDGEPRWKIMFKETHAGLRKRHLYDLEADPAELENLAGRGHKRFQELLVRYRQWRDRTGRQDHLYRGTTMDVQEEDLEMLRALGYVGDDEEPGESGDR